MECLKDIKLVVADLDGTLLKEDKSLDSHIQRVLQTKDVQFTLASGRNYHIIQDLVTQLNITLPYITNNGANIFQKDQCIYECSIDPVELTRCLELLYKEEVAFLAYSNTMIFSHGNQPGLDHFMQRLIGKCTIVKDASLTDIIKEAIFKVVMIHPEMERIKDEMNAMTQKTLCIQSEGIIYTLTNKSATKGIALKSLMDQLGLKKEEVLVFGDNYNDASMFEVANGVAMENAQDSLKEISMFQTKSNDENGVSWFIERYL